mmetsp:Transcript_99856/g.280768  ORF Transcript_99856/g.280768 Transcript_99856/m.280768 type:complete len:213 (+) Transcript_99856:651-1289(+)
MPRNQSRIASVYRLRVSVSTPSHHLSSLPGAEGVGGELCARAAPLGTARAAPMLGARGGGSAVAVTPPAARSGAVAPSSRPRPRATPSPPTTPLSRSPPPPTSPLPWPLQPPLPLPLPPVPPAVVGGAAVGSMLAFGGEVEDDDVPHQAPPSGAPQPGAADAPQLEEPQPGAVPEPPQPVPPFQADIATSRTKPPASTPCQTAQIPGRAGPT